MKNFGTRSCLINWRTFDDGNFGIQWQMDSTYEQNLIFQPFVVLMLKKKENNPIFFHDQGLITLS